MTPQSFIAKWQAADGSERANYPLFFNDLCDLLGVERPQPAKADDWHNGYVNERYIDARDGESAGTARYIDTYHRGRFICEAKSFAVGKHAETAERNGCRASSTSNVSPGASWNNWNGRSASRICASRRKTASKP